MRMIELEYNEATSDQELRERLRLWALRNLSINQNCFIKVFSSKKGVSRKLFVLIDVLWDGTINLYPINGAVFSMAASQQVEHHIVVELNYLPKLPGGEL